MTTAPIVVGIRDPRTVAAVSTELLAAAQSQAPTRATYCPRRFQPDCAALPCRAEMKANLCSDRANDRAVLA
jgi:hypothetical protein